MKKEDIELKLNEIKTDLEIKLVKIELLKLKHKEDNLLKNENVKKDIKVKEKTIANKKKQSIKKPKNQEKLIPEKKKELNKVVENKKTERKRKPLIKSSTHEKKQSPKKIIAKKERSLTEKKSAKKETLKTKTNPTIKKYLVLGIFVFTALLFTLRYVYRLKSELNNKEELLIEEEKKMIDFNSDNYFKDVEDVVSEEDLQDFNIYKDIPELVIKNSKKTSPRKSTKLKTIKDNITLNSNNENEENNLINNDIENLKNNEIIDTSENNKITNEESKVTSDFIKIVGLQYITKNGKFILPIKSKKTDSFSIRVRLNKYKKTTFNNKVKIMLVIKNAVGKTLKIDIKEVDFSINKTVYLTFYETIAEKLEINKSYNFSIFANSTLIKSATKTI